MRRSTALIGVLASAGLVAAAVPAQAQPTTGPDRATHAIGLLRSHAAEARADGEQSFTVKDVTTDADGSTHVRLHRYYRGLPVIGGDLVVHADRQGDWRGVSQTMQGTPRLSVAAGIAAGTAGAVALAASTAADRTIDGQQLVVFAAGASNRLAYEVVVGGIQSDQTPSQLHVLVAADSGATLRSWETIEADGVGHGFHDGDVAVGTTLVSGKYQLKDAARGNHATFDLLNKTRLAHGALPVSQTANVFGDGTLANRDSISVDAHYGAAKTWDYYKNVLGRLGIKNNGVGSTSRTHYGTNYVNAFWDDNCFCMTYGDGDLSQGYYPLVSLDVAGHEMSHGVTSATANLTYSGESGGLNESTSDIFGTMVEFYAANPKDAPDYLIGEKLTTTGTPFRYMDDPTKDGKSAGCWYSGVGSLNVHYSSGVGNHFFYLLAVGSGSSQWGNSPTCAGAPAVSGIGNDAAAKIWYRALSVYMTSGTDYHAARAATLSAATDLYGATSTQHNAVAAAWTAVGVS